MMKAYTDTRDSAKSRNIPWNFTPETFAQFAKYSKLLKGRGITKYSWHIDRIDEDDPRGYHPDNVQVVENVENVQKEHRRRKWAKLKGYLAEAGFPQITRGPEILEPEIIKSVQYEFQPNEFGGYERRGWLKKYPAGMDEKPDENIPF